MPSQWNYIRIIPLLLLCFKGECHSIVDVWVSRVISETWDWLSTGLSTIYESIASFKTKLQNEIGWENCPNSHQLYIISLYPTKTFKKITPFFSNPSHTQLSHLMLAGLDVREGYFMDCSYHYQLLFCTKASGNSASMTYIHTCTCL